MKVASTVDDDQAFTARAREAAEALGARAIGATKRFLYTPPAKPDALAGKHEGFGDWMWVCQQQIPDYHRIRAALLLRDLVPGDAEVTAQLSAWSDTHPDEAVRRQLREILSPAR